MNLLNDLFNGKFEKGAALLGPVGFLLNMFYGVGNLIWIGILLSVTALDWISGISAAKKDGTYTSEYGKAGVFRTLVMFLLPVVGNLIDIALKTSMNISGFEFGIFFFMITGGLIYHTLMSAAANFKRAGWERWVPVKVLESIASEIQAKAQRSDSRKNILNQDQTEGEDMK
ncbi:phage holin family protein [Metabacillus bambusae]|uniref:Phage holin family protein n=1 Tax=Metabacillus bambusae TaxID=2795218 RepID=A0ABS3NBT2_9BACI|nr:phage holin family protein [Metabacillus bambusae]MBO1515501.1 phage holin family protein [Metabacillus bambusae]